MNEIEVLLVEDNPHDAELIIRAMEKYGLTRNIKVLEDGAQALRYFYAAEPSEDGHPHNHLKMILLDLKLPKVDGLEVLRRLKADPGTRTIPVVVMTSSQEEKDIQECYRLGVNSYIVKPVDFDRFMESVAEVGMYWLSLNKTP